MTYVSPVTKQKSAFDAQAVHPLQGWAWGEFRKKTGVVVERLFDGDHSLQVTFHKLPFLGLTVGYLPRSEMLDAKALQALNEVGHKHKAIFIKLEPNVSAPADEASSLSREQEDLRQAGLRKGRALFTDYSFQLDLTQTEDELLKGMKSKTRYNVRLAERKGVKVRLDNSEAAFEEYIRLWKETTERQGFYAHSERYQRQMWQALREAKIAHLLKATYKQKTLAVWIVFVFNKVLYYPYGASTREHQELMANNALMWEAIRFGKKMDCTAFDMWGALGPDPKRTDSWYGFHTFKAGYGATLVEFVGSYDLVLKPFLYPLFRLIDEVRWVWLRFKKR